MKKPATLAEAFDLTEKHWRDIIEFLKKWYEENDRWPDPDNGDDVPENIAWFADNCGLCSFFIKEEEKSCTPCPLVRCGGVDSIYLQFRLNPTISNAELMLAEVERKENEN